MKYVDEYRDKQITRGLVEELHRITPKPLRIMEVCGTHTMSIFRSGIRSILPEGFELLSGPGCPVCVTSAGHMDTFLAMAQQPRVHLAIFGDLFRVPGSTGSLADISAMGGAIDIVYSPMDALELAVRRPEELVVFLGVGFETTTPTVAATILAASTRHIDNFTVFSTHKIMPPPLETLLSDSEVQIDGLLCPGHVATIIGAQAFQGLVDRYGLCCCVAGFEPADILNALIHLTRQIATGTPRVENCYPRAVSWQRNERAMKLLEMVFEPCDMEWRGLGIIPGSGLKIRDQFSHFDAEKRISIPAVPTTTAEPAGCRCGQILKGQIRPTDCPLFAKSCTPASPIGPCMVSSEGTCAAYYKYQK